MEELVKENEELKKKLISFNEPLNVFSINHASKNKIDKVVKFITIYSIAIDNVLTLIQTKILAYYIIKGLSDETLQMIIDDDPRYDEDKKQNKKAFNFNHLYGINKILRDKKYLEKSLTNERKFFLSPKMKELSLKINKNGCKGIIVSL